jgi:hypothetical protein
VEQIQGGDFDAAAVAKSCARGRASQVATHPTHGAAGGRVMLHLRSRYVSKAAIFMIMVSPIPIENRSPA